MKTRRSIQELAQDAGITPVATRQPCLPAPSQPAIIASEEDHMVARSLLVDQRRNDPDYRDPSKQLKRIFRSSKEKEKLQDTTRWEFSQDELDQALSAVIDKPSTTPGLVQAFLNLGAKVNFIEPSDEKRTKGIKKPNAAVRRRSTVLQRAATTRRSDSVSLLASSGADQTTLDEGLKAALATNDHSCTQELLRHGADINKFPNALADAVRSNDQNLVRLLLRAPKSLRPEIVSSCLPGAVQQKSEPVISLLIGYGADPNFDGASALKMTLSLREYRLAVALAAGPIALTVTSLHGALDIVFRMPELQELQQYVHLLLCCGLPPDSLCLPELLVRATKSNNTFLALLLIDHGVFTGLNEAECLRNAIANSNWTLTDAILKTPLSPAHASVALAVLPTEAPKDDRLRVIGALVQRGASGSPLGRWLIRAVEEGDSALVALLVNAGAPLDSGNHSAIHAAVAKRDLRGLRTLLVARPTGSSLAQVFPLLRHGYKPSERLETARLLLEHGAQGLEVDQALIDAVADTTASRDLNLIEELVRHNANVNHDNGKAICLATTQADIPILQLLCGSNTTPHTTSTALPLAFKSNGNRHSTTLQIMELLLASGVEENPATQALQIAINDGPQNLDIISCLISASARLIGPAFQYAIALDSNDRKLPILTMLLQMNVPQDCLDEALVTETRKSMAKNDWTILKLLLDYGARANYHDGEALSVAVHSKSIALIQLLLDGRQTPSKITVTKAFRTLFHDSESQGASGARASSIDIATKLLCRGVDQPAIDSALRITLDNDNLDHDAETLVDLLLQYRADVNTADGTCFVFAARRNAFSIFVKLLTHAPDFTTIVPALVKSKLEESTVIKAVGLCFDHGCTSDSLEFGSYGLSGEPLLVMALKEYPRRDALVKLLLNNGCNPDIATSYAIDRTVGEESVSPLIWALAQPQKMISTSVVVALLGAGASPIRRTPMSEISPLALAAREGRQDVVQELLNRGADASARDKWNRSPLFYASSTSVTTIVQSLCAHALKDDGSLHEAARYLQVDAASILIKHGHNPNFPCRLHGGRNALGELCIGAEVTDGSQRTKVRQLIRTLLDNGANPKFKARNEKSAVVLALDNPYNALEVTEALLETEIWEELNDEKHMFRDNTRLWYSPIKYVELVPHFGRQSQKQEILELLGDKGCEPKYYSEQPEQPDGAIGLPSSIARLADRQKEHQLSLKLAKEASEHARMLEEATHRDALRRKKEQEDAEMASQAAAHAQWTQLEQSKHEFEMQRVRSAERMKRSEKVAWHNLQVQQEQDFATQRQQIEERKASAALQHEAKMIQQRQAEMDYRADVERKALLEKEQLFERNVQRQKQLTDRLDESAQLHARLRQERPAIEPAQWGNVD
ncbi:ankyrin [Zopfia rhizophila CBS 207.26]|uniref:Ankyrin n=1 Tax=Zopfia rhizophila CBS 207.26 TaxID=1314779 RepID=A0A6A6EGE9_9PEZI|nr:ankyrin [Zopfia rhizophila CBS 207.26]